MNRPRLVATLLMALALAGAALPAPADARSPYLEVARQGGGNVAVSRDQAAAIARSRTGGRVLSVDLRNGGRPYYRVKVLVSGDRVRSVGVDATTGAVIE